MANVTLKPINTKLVSFGIVGTSPLIQHAWSEKAIRQLRMTAAERRKQPKTSREPEAEGEAAMYRLESGAPAFPLLAFKASLISAAHKDIGLEKTLVRKSFFLPPVPDMLVELEHGGYIIREDLVRVGADQADIRYRPEFQEWRVQLQAIVDFDNLNEGNIINLINRAGFGVGVGEWRPEKGGEYGRFMVDTSVPVKVENYGG